VGQPHHLNPWSGRIAEVGDAIVSILFPADCRLCKGLLTRASRVPICEACLASFQPLQGRTCEICGAGFQASFGATEPPRETEDGAGSDRRICRVCASRPYAFNRARSYAEYQEALVQAIVTLKFERIEPLAKWFADRLAELVRAEPDLMQADVVVPVPLHRNRLRERGYNQADLLGRALARNLRLPYRAVLLTRTRPRPDKHILTSRERWESVRGAFATRPGSQVDNLRVLLVDDVMTTGATLDACSKALRVAGAKSVVAVTVARAVLHPATYSL
jgi:ComF family protein